jgi:transcription initiation factor TFIID TATA-box-binding protein
MSVARNPPQVVQANADEEVSSSTRFPEHRLNMPTADRSLWPKLQNVVSTFSMSCRIDLKILGNHARNVEYNPKRFAAAIVRIRSPKTTCLIFSNGKCVVTGAKSQDESRLAARKFVRIVQKLGFNPKFEDFKIRNIVANAAAVPQIPAQSGNKRAGIKRQKEFIKLEEFALKHNKFADYMPEVFAGCVYKMMKPSICLLIFINGKIVFTGAKKVEDLDEAYRLIVPALLGKCHSS